MREIKFRAWRKDGRKKVGGVMDYDACQCCPCETCGESHHGDVVWLQFTGLKDKSGKEIYEGDLIRDLQHPDKPVYEIAWSEVETAYYRKPPYKHDPEDYPWKGWYAENSEVIGNIYENPELIEPNGRFGQSK